MKKTVVHVPFDEEKLSAARLYMAQKELSFEEEMEKAAEHCMGNMFLPEYGNSLR